MMLPLNELHNVSDIVEYNGEEGVVIDMIPSCDGLDDFLKILLVSNGKVVSTMDSHVKKMKSGYSVCAQKISIAIRIKGIMGNYSQLQRMSMEDTIWNDICSDHYGKD